jgi:5-methylcytosine-specific restriction enzyme A
MRYSSKYGCLVLTTDLGAGIYSDRWEGDYLQYTGMGREGDQQLTSQNKRLNSSRETGLPIYLFEKQKTNQYFFHGRVRLAGNPFVEPQRDMHGRLRKAWVFPLKIDDTGRAISDEVLRKAFDNDEERALKDPLEVLRKRIESSNRGHGFRHATTDIFLRNPDVSAYAKLVADGVCQLCNMPAPFQNKKGQPFLETHHIVWLSKGGEDAIDNTVALCPNCHRKMHSLNPQKDQKKLREKAERPGTIRKRFLPLPL